MKSSFVLEACVFLVVIAVTPALSADTKPDCRRVKFQTENPEIDIVIGVDTDLKDCLEGVNDKNADLLLSESAAGSNNLETKHPKGAEIIVYMHARYEGPEDIMYLQKNQCSKFTNGFDKQISSIDTKGSCINIYQNSDCTGRSAKLGPEVTRVNSFLGTDIYMNDYISSVRLC